MATKVEYKALKEFQEATETLANPEIQKWRKQGGKVLGYFCSYVPEEIITAAGFMPFRMRATGSTGTELSDAYFSSINCSFCRHALNLGMQGKYDFIDGAVWINTCDHVRRVYDNWKRVVATPFVHIMSVPRTSDEPQVIFYRTQLENFKKTLEGHFGVKITQEKLREAIGLHNKTRRLQRKLYNLRKGESPPITGAETLTVMVAGTAMPKEQYNQSLKELLNEISQSKGRTEHRARLMLTGAILDDPAYVKAIEDQGGLVVTDSLCFGTRTMWKTVDEKASDPLTALARYHITERPSCPRALYQKARRTDFVMKMIRDFKVDGVIGERLVMCDLWLGEHYILDKDFRANGIPFLRLDREYLLSGIGQLRTRVQAFLERMGR
jgi:bzd-type benzoyl-CoA reductase N subunit